MAIDLNPHDIPPPGGLICNECTKQLLEHPELPGVTACYCEHYQCGGIYSAIRRMWHLYTPISAEQFADEIANGLEKFGAMGEAQDATIQ